VGSSHGLGASSQENKATDAAIDKAGQYCHAKREKLLVTSAIGNVINFGAQRTARTDKIEAPPMCVSAVPDRRKVFGFWWWFRLEAGNARAKAALLTVARPFRDPTSRHEPQA
jgi:hypothetical protein